MQDFDWVKYAIPIAILIFSVLRRASGPVKRGIEAAGRGPAGDQPAADDLRRAIEAQRTAAAAAAATPAGRAARLGPPRNAGPAPAPRPAPAAAPSPRAPSPPRSPQQAVIAPVTEPGVPTAGGRSLQSALRSVAGAQQAVILAEILAPPIALR